MISIANVIRMHAEKCSREAFLPSPGFESMMKIRRPELRESPASPKSLSPSQLGSPEPIKPGEIIEVYNNGKWTKIEWKPVSQAKEE